MFAIVHIIFALAVGNALTLPLLPLMIGAILPDIESLFPLIEHRTMFHTIITGIALTVLFYPKFKKKSIAFFIGFFTHIFLDSFSSMGIAVLWPFSMFMHGFYVAPADVMNIIFFFIGLLILLSSNIIQDFIIKYKSENIRKTTYSIMAGFIVFLLIFGRIEHKCEGQEVSIENLLANSSMAEKQVIVKGRICSEIDSYKSQKGNNYEIFDLCQNDYSIKIWKLANIPETPLENKDVSICGTYTLEYKEPEVTFVKYLKYE